MGRYPAEIAEGAEVGLGAGVHEGAVFFCCN